MRSLYIIRNNSTDNEIECNYHIAKYVRLITNDPDVKDYTLEDYKKESKNKDKMLYLIVPDLPEKSLQKINKFMTDVSKRYGFETHGLSIDPKK